MFRGWDYKAGWAPSVLVDVEESALQASAEKLMKEVRFLVFFWRARCSPCAFAHQVATKSSGSTLVLAGWSNAVPVVMEAGYIVFY